MTGTQGIRRRCGAVLTLWRALALAAVLAATSCDDGPEPPPAPPPPLLYEPPVRSSVPAHGYMVGSATRVDSEYRYNVVGLITAEAEVRLHFTTFQKPGATPDEPAEAAQLVGSVVWDGVRGNGQGDVIGGNCMPPEPGRFCDVPAPAQIMIQGPRSQVEGIIEVTTEHGIENWFLDIRDWSIYYAQRASYYPQGIYTVHEASFAAGQDVVVNVDAGGRLFFQSAASGCTGNGALRPHGDGKYFVFDVELVIESCIAPYAGLNRVYEGLATETQSGFWDYDSSLSMVLTTPPEGEPRQSLAVFASRF